MVTNDDKDEGGKNIIFGHDEWNGTEMEKKMRGAKCKKGLRERQRKKERKKEDV